MIKPHLFLFDVDQYCILWETVFLYNYKEKLFSKSYRIYKKSLIVCKLFFKKNSLERTYTSKGCMTVHTSNEKVCKQKQGN